MKYVLDQNMACDNKIEKFLKEGNDIILINEFIVEPFKAAKSAWHLFLEYFCKIFKK